MSVSWVAGSTFQGVEDTDQVTATSPAGVTTGDTLLACLFHRSALTVPSGWTKIAESALFEATAIGVSQRISVLSKSSVTSGDASTGFTFQQASSGRMGIAYAVLRGASTLVGSAAWKADDSDTWTATPPSMTATANGQMVVALGSTIGTLGASSPTVPASFTLASGSAISQYRLACAYRAVDNAQSTSGSFNFYPSDDPPSLTLGFTNGLGAVALLFGGASEPPTEGLLAAPGVLGSQAILGRHASHVARLAVASPLGRARMLAEHDFTGLIVGLQIYYVMDLITGAERLRVPITNWQATLRAGSSSYVQCNVRAVEPWVDAINAAEEFSILRQVITPDGAAIEYEMARAPIQNATLSQGPFNYTGTLTGYSLVFGEVEESNASQVRSLQDVRSVFVSGVGLRVRCSIDWLLRPGQFAIFNDLTFSVGRISYYCTTEDQYMDVGQIADV